MLVLFCLWDSTGGCCPHDDPVSTNSRCYGSASCSPPLTRRGSPSDFVLFSVLLGLVALSFFLLGGWGAPCRVFLFPLALVAVLSSGWVGSPCRVIPVFSPWFLGGWGGVFVFLLPSLASCIFLSLAARKTWSTDPQTPRPPPPFSLVRRS